MNWLSLHIFFTSDKTTFIKKCIIPLIDEFNMGGHLENYFFINYNEGGPHIRLRLLPMYDSNSVLGIAQSAINRYFEQNPSPKDEIREPSYYSNDTIQIIGYEPEIARYGGKLGIKISELQFRRSTEMVLLYYAISKSNVYNGFLNFAIKLHLTTAFVYCDGDLGKAILFFNCLFSGGHSPITNYLIKVDNKNEKIYYDYYLVQKDVLKPYINLIWDSLKEENDIDEYLVKWKIEERKTKSELLFLFQKEELEFPELFENQPLWSIVQSYVHMTNNRLGILPIDEALISFLILNSLKEI